MQKSVFLPLLKNTLDLREEGEEEWGGSSLQGLAPPPHPGAPLLPHSRARSLDEVTHAQGHDVILPVALQTGLITHCCILNPGMERSAPAAKPRFHLVDVLANDPRSSARLSLRRQNRNDSYRF